MKRGFNTLLLLVLLFACKEEKKQEVSTKNEQQVQLVEQLRNQVKQNPDSTPVRMRLVNALDSLGNYAAAITQVDSLIARDSLNNGLWFAKAQLQESLKDTTAAINSYEKAVSIYPSIDAQLSLANLLAETKDSRSLLICNTVAKVAMDRQIIAHCNFIAGIYHARTGKAEKAIQLFDEAIKSNYTYMEAYMEKGFLYYDQKKYDKALQVFDRAITVNNQYADAYYWKAKTYEAAGDKTEAITNYQRSLGLDKNLTEARVALDRLDG